MNMWKKNWVLWVVIIIVASGAIYYAYHKGFFGSLGQLTDLKHPYVTVNLSDSAKSDFERQVADIKKQISSKDDKGTGNLMSAYLSLGHVYEELGRRADEVVAINEASKQDQANPAPLVSLAVVYKDDGQIQRAIDLLKTALAKRGDYLPAYQELIKLYWDHLHDNDMTKGTFIDALRATNNSLAIEKGFAVFLEATGDNSEALLYWQDVVKKEPTNTDAINRVKALTTPVKK